MEKVLLKLKEAAEIKSNISKQESLFWKAISEAIENCDSYQNQFKNINLDISEPHNQAKAYMNTTEAAAYLGLKYGTLAGWRFYGTGPKYVKMGGAIRYKTRDLDNFAEKNMTTQAPPYPRRK